MAWHIFLSFRSGDAKVVFPIQFSQVAVNCAVIEPSDYRETSSRDKFNTAPSGSARGSLLFGSPGKSAFYGL